MRNSEIIPTHNSSRQWRIQEFQKGMRKRGSVPSGVPGRSPGGGLGAKPPRSYGHYATFATHNNRKLQYKDNTTKQDKLIYFLFIYLFKNSTQYKQYKIEDIIKAVEF